MNAPSNPMLLIEARSREYRDAKDLLVERAQALNDELEACKRRHLRGLRAAVATVTAKRDELQATLEEFPHLFVKPRTVVFHGVKVGFQLGAGKIDWDDDEQLVRLIRKHFPQQFDVLVKTTEKPVKDALKGLTAVELKRLGVSVEGTGDVPVIRDTTAAVDKLVKALLKGAEEEAAS
ncbi:hypothetical protein APR50_17270 [Variovorax paradoxus]|jgi:hypothetical protein|uniref:hypothetical protein n=1 Tax=Variovorax paradoxus TaxID=34073 RepID=UPI0006E69A8A|nr:hypothetical protein APR50_17270 [Variovorax paradoxus]KPV06724.1 hypothetical protein APR49_19045 [Variovorax paradoxus]KPV32236.1 hypothetical protein APR48_14090 [Variovorax paradoxus]KPV34965.1 hypothetical protein APR47_14665 [Variovorax paradoxus]